MPRVKLYTVDRQGRATVCYSQDPEPASQEYKPTLAEALEGPVLAVGCFIMAVIVPAVIDALLGVNP